MYSASDPEEHPRAVDFMSIADDPLKLLSIMVMSNHCSMCDKELTVIDQSKMVMAKSVPRIGVFHLINQPTYVNREN